MKATQILHDLGQSLWLDNITRDLSWHERMEVRASKSAVLEKASEARNRTLP
jgi:hypothetical protein